VDGGSESFARRPNIQLELARLVGAATIGQGDIRVIVNALGTVTPIATVAAQTQLSGRLLEVGFTKGGQEAQPVTWYSDRNSKFSFATEEPVRS
jgi:hypothetical protein